MTSTAGSGPRPAPVARLVSVGAALAGALMLAGCSAQRDTFLNPAGPIAAAQRSHLIEVVALTMIAVVPVFVLVPVLLWRYRYANRKARYSPNWDFSGWLDLLMWGVPFAIVGVLSTMLWHSTKALDPYKPIEPAASRLEVQVVGLDWKWLFVYPDLGIATVNELGFPANASVSLDLTTDTVMQSFMISALAGQVYAMAGMRTKLHVLADEPGTFEGENTQFNGTGFTEQKFAARAMTQADFDAWVERVRADGIALDGPVYARLAEQSTGTAAHAALGSPAMPADGLYFAPVEPGLFDRILRRYHDGTAVPPSEQPGAAAYRPDHASGGAAEHGEHR